jgi:ribosome-binding protein aMBF1 (putative translation factor)|tara:strand:- start:2468 stop:2827 length:360 start_codon:yes stop_codon:yes gene_type:complete
MDYQDWTEVKIGGGKISNDKKKPPVENKKNYQNMPGTKQLRKLEEDEIVTIEKIKLDDSKLIEQKRTMCKLTQKDLATQLSIPFTIIRDFENGKGEKNKTLFSKINRYLDNKIKNMKEK